MNVSFTCHQCGAELEADATEGGGQAKCPGCETTLTIPAPGIGPGVTLGGFRIDEKLGAGGMGEVFLATQLSMGRKVALKVLPPALTMKKANVDRFLHEVQALGKLEHPNIVTAFEAGEDGGHYFLAMSLIDGYDLEHRLTEVEHLDEQEALRIVLKTAAALKFAWDEHRMLHRDLKPANIMVDKSGEVKLMDMGLSKSMAESAQLTMTGTIMGTPHYMSPEQAQAADRTDFRSDIYSLGATLYHLVTGTVPYAGSSAIEVVTKHVLAPFPPPQERNPDLSDACTHLLEVMMAKKAEDRYASWDALIADVERVLVAQAPAAARPAAGASVVMPAGSVTVPQPTHSVPIARSQTRALAAQAAAAQARQRLDQPPAKRSALSWVLPLVGVLLVVGVVGAVLMMQQEPPPASISTPAIPDPEPAKVDDGSDPAPVPKSDPLQKMFEYAATFSKAQPEAYDEAIAKFQRVQQDAAGSQYALMAGDEIRKLNAAKEAAIDMVMDDLKAKAKALLADKKYDEAIAVIRDYQGQFAVESAARRRQGTEQVTILVDRLGEQAQAATARFEAVADAAAEAVLAADPTRALRTVKAAAAELTEPAMAADLATLTAELTALTQLPDLILASLREDIGKPVKVELTSGVETLEAERVEGRTISAMKVMPRGKIKRNFHYDDISAAEKLRRLGREQTPELDRLRGLLAIEVGRSETARRYFERAGGQLGPAIARQLDRQGAAAAETSAKRAIVDLLQLAGLPPNQQDLEALVSAAVRKRFDRRTATQINQVIVTLRREHGQQPAVAALEPLFKALAAAPVADEADAPALPPVPAAKKPGPTPARKPATQEVVDAALAELAKVNGIDRLAVEVKWVKGNSMIDLKVTHNGRLRDIGPLAGLPLAALDIAGPIETLAPLSGMPLESLVVGHAKTNDLGLVAQLPVLTYLRWYNAPLPDFSLFRQSGLQSLHLSQVPDVSLASIITIESLKTLVLNDCDVQDFDPLRRLKRLTALAIADMPLTNLDFVKRLQLQTYLDVVRAPKLTDISGLAKQPFDGLAISDAPVSDIDVLASCESLTTLRLTRLPALTDIAALRRCPHLKRLSLTATGVSDISPLRRVPLLELRLTECPVQDISPLLDCQTLEHLWLPDAPENIEGLRKLQKLKTINDLPVDIFWKHYFLQRAQPAGD